MRHGRAAALALVLVATLSVAALLVPVHTGAVHVPAAAIPGVGHHVGIRNVLPNVYLDRMAVVEIVTILAVGAAITWWIWRR